MTIPPKVIEVLTSKKFWSTVAGIAATWTAYYTHSIDANTAVQATVAAIGAYVIAVGLQDQGKAQQPPTA